MEQTEAIQEGRNRLKMSQEHLASAAGISARTVVRAESGFRVSGESLRNICAVLGLDAATLSPVASKAPVIVPAEDARPSVEAPAAPEPAAATSTVWRRLLGLRRTPLMVIPLAFILSSSLVGFIPIIERVAVLGDAARWSLESSPARATAGYVNALAAGKPGIKPPSFSFTTCSQDEGRWQRFFRWISEGECLMQRHEILTETFALPDGTLQTVAGPVGREFGRDLARRLSGDPGVRWRVAFASGRQASGLAWFDPRTVPTMDMPRPPDSPSTWVYVAMTKTGSAR